MKNYAIILASGSGSRAGLDIPKQFYKLNGKTILEYAVQAYDSHCSIDSVIVVSNPDFADLTKEIINKSGFKKVIKVVNGGLTRQESSCCGVFAVEEENSNVLIHDAVRPFVTPKIISDCIDALGKYNAVNTAVECSDTIIEIDENNFIKNVPIRSQLKRCQTPQCFKTHIIKTAHNLAKNENYNSATDDCSLILKYKLSKIFVVNGSENNIKITYPSDLKEAEHIARNLY